MHIGHPVWSACSLICLKEVHVERRGYEQTAAISPSLWNHARPLLHTVENMFHFAFLIKA